MIRARVTERSQITTTIVNHIGYPVECIVIVTIYMHLYPTHPMHTNTYNHIHCSLVSRLGPRTIVQGVHVLILLGCADLCCHVARLSVIEIPIVLFIMIWYNLYVFMYMHVRG